ncbi:SMC domain protein [Desulfofundulus kuznetsovii DSM 6115]|uniref:SMC domain protein n=1 Tax=Desulfofundulus kuznetsovii (strain DSM 6115 / VKM B-1805 / 17) TaxID=760568 RepID=A0AAU8PQV9_DESK7|nr:SMC domain protein [Desulfofundulus kuznetsovii DSM 6115]
MILEAIRVKGFRSLRELDWVPLYNITILTGGNDTGKSSFIEAVNILFSERNRLSEQDFSRFVSEQAGEIVIEGRLRLNTEEIKKLKEIESNAAELITDDCLYIRKVIAKDGSQSLDVKKMVCEDIRVEQILVQPRVRAQEVIDLCNELGIDISDSRNQEHRLEKLRQWRSEQHLVEGWVPVTASLRQFLPLIELFSSESALDPENEINKYLKSFFPELLRNEKYAGRLGEIQSEIQSDLDAEVEKIVPIIQKYVPDIEAVSIRPRFTFESGLGHCSLEIKKRGQVVDLMRSGAGIRRRLSLAALEWGRQLLQNRTKDSQPLLIAFDEPDSHLDYNQQRKIFGIIKSFAGMPNVQVVVATHSLNLIDRVPLEQINHFNLDSSSATYVERLSGPGVTDPEVQEFLYVISQTMGLKNSILLHERCFLVVEGDTEMNALPGLFYKLYGMQLQAAGICLVNGESDTGARTVARHLQKMRRNVLFLLDNDVKNSPRSRIFTEEQLRADGFDLSKQVHYVGIKEFEDSFPNAVWVKVAEKFWPKHDGTPWVESDFEAIRSSEKFSDALKILLQRESKKDASKKDIGYRLAQEVAKEEIPKEICDCFAAALSLAN